VGTSVLVSEVMDEARLRLSWPAFSSSTYWTTTEALNVVKFSARRLSALVRRAYGSDYFTTTTTVTTTSGNNVVALPTNFSDLRQIAWVRSADDVVPMEMATTDDIDATGETARAWDSAPRYRMLGGSLYVYPKPNAVYTLSLYYDTGIYVTATSDSISCQPGWDEWLVLDFCIRARQSEERDASDFLTMLAKVEKDIVDQAASRDRFRVHQVRDLWTGEDAVLDSRSLYVRR
jgi:hypothetical protein